MNNLLRNFFNLNIKTAGVIRQVETNASLLENCKEVVNNNPRNLELMTIARKPRGYDLDDECRKVNFWHRLQVRQTRNYVKAELYHFENGPVITVMSKDACLRKFLYRPNHISAYKNVGKIIGKRCLESGIVFVHHYIPKKRSQKLAAFIRGVRKSGLFLGEPEQYKNPTPWNKRAPVKPWTVIAN